MDLALYKINIIIIIIIIIKVMFVPISYVEYMHCYW